MTEKEQFFKLLQIYTEIKTKYEKEKEETPWYQNTSNCVLDGVLDELNSLNLETIDIDGVTCYLRGRREVLEELHNSYMKKVYMMTENKRFKLHIEWYNKEKTDGEATLYERGQPLGVIESMEDARLIRNILNELYDENEELKQAYVKLKHYHSNLHDECIELECDKDRYYNDVLTLEKENEQLKKENETQKDTIESLTGNIMYVIDHFGMDKVL